MCENSPGWCKESVFSQLCFTPWLEACPSLATSGGPPELGKSVFSPEASQPRESVCRWRPGHPFLGLSPQTCGTAQPALCRGRRSNKECVSRTVFRLGASGCDFSGLPTLGRGRGMPRAKGLPSERDAVFLSPAPPGH